MIVKPIYNFKAHLSQFLIGKVELARNPQTGGTVAVPAKRSQFLIGKVGLTRVFQQMLF